MLARANRVTRPADFRTAVRRGRRSGAGSLVVHVVARASDSPVRFGFVVSKSVGNAVARNRVRRRLRAASREFLQTIPGGHDVVVRAQPGAAELPWAVLQREFREGIGRAVRS